MARQRGESEFPLRRALEAAEPKPALAAKSTEKKNYAERLSRELAVTVASGLRWAFPDINPREEDPKHERPFAVGGGTKRLDVTVWSERDKAGLLLDVSIKTYSFQDWKGGEQSAGRMTKNVVRNDMELAAEAQSVHDRQPWAVLVGLMFTPWEACDDGKTGPSSFAHMVTTFRKRTGREGPHDARSQLFEALYIGLYQYEGERRGAARFFNVLTDPPRQGRPRLEDTLDFFGLCREIERLVRERNSSEPTWAEPGDDF